MIDKITRSPWFYRGVSLVLALLLFSYVSGIGGPVGSANKSLVANATETFEGIVPEVSNIDTNKYIVTGLPAHVKIKVDGPKGDVTALKNTKNFRIVADLKDKGTGKYQVKLKPVGISKNVLYTIQPETVELTVEKKGTKKMPVKVKYNSKQIAAGYEAGTPELSQDNVTVTGAKANVDKVKEVVAVVDIKNSVRDDVKSTVTLQALDKNGSVVNVLVEPNKIDVRIPVTATGKSVAISLTEIGDPATGYKYRLKSDVSHVTLVGDQDVLDRINTIEIPVDISGIIGTVTRTVTVPLPAGATHATPKSVKVTIEAISENAKDNDSDKEEPSKPKEDPSKNTSDEDGDQSGQEDSSNGLDISINKHK